MTEINKNIKKVKTPPIDYFNNLLKYKSNTNIPQISFGHGIPMHTPVDYHTFKNNILLESSSYKYTEIKGKYDIRKFISKKIDSKTSFDVTPDNFIITSGANSALFKSLFLHLDEGDQIMIPSPVYFNHAMAIEMIGGVVVEVNTKPNNGFQLDIDNIINNINDKTKSIIINSPNNPTGAIYDTNDIKKLSEYWIAAQDRINLFNSEITFLKTHNALCTFENNSFTNKLNTKAAIYIVRDPRNVITSVLNHYSFKNIEEPYARTRFIDRLKQKTTIYSGG